MSKLIERFEDKVADLIDDYMRLGLTPYQVRLVLDNQRDGLEERRKELFAPSAPSSASDETGGNR